jgi:hypothetical protein
MPRASRSPQALWKPGSELPTPEEISGVSSLNGGAYGLFLQNGVLVTHDWGSGQTRSTGVNLADGQFHHVAMTFQSGVNGGTTIYADGLQVLTTTITVLDQVQALAIGAGNLGTIQFFNGTIDEAKLYDRVLTSEEIQANVNTGGAY